MAAQQLEGTPQASMVGGSARLSGGRSKSVRGLQVYRETGQVGSEGPGPGGMAELPWSPSSDPLRGLALPRPATGILAFTLQAVKG